MIQIIDLKLFEKAKDYFSSDDLEESLKILKKLQYKYKNNYVLCNNIAISELSLSNLSLAFRYFKKSLDIKENFQAYFGLCTIYYSIKEYKKCYKCLLKVIELKDDFLKDKDEQLSTSLNENLKSLKRNLEEHIERGSY